MDPYDHLESERMRRDENRHFIIQNKEFLCDNCFLHPMKVRKGKYIPGNLYNQTKEILIKYWNMKRLLVLHSSGYIPDLANYEISESIIKCE